MNEAPAAGGWSVDDRCTNCDVARQLAPGLIVEVRGRSAVLRAPRDDAEVRQLHAAAHACPSRSIHPPDGRLDAALDPFPMALDDTVYLCGHNSRHTAGANSYLLRRPGGTSMMVDTPRWSSALADRYEALGPVTDALLTLSDEHRVVVVRAYYRRQTIAEIAADLGIPPGTVKSRLHYGLRSLRLALQERGVTR